LAQRAPQGVMTDSQGATIGFEMLVTALVAEAEALGVIQQHGDDILGRSIELREAKLAKLKGYKINRFTSLAFSAEMVGLDKKELLDIENLREANGSVGHSPSATAYFAIHVCPKDRSALDYLHNVVSPDGGAPNVAPFDIFEQAWSLWNLALTGPLDSETLALCQPHLDFIEAAWKPGKGIPFAAGYTPLDVDDSCVAYEVLKRYGRSVDIEGILSYEREDHFNCFALEVNPSVSAHIHVLDVLRLAGFERQHPSVQKVLRFLAKTQIVGTFWFDKWHCSPYYTSGNAVIACAGYADDVAQNTVDWILATQGTEGAWGYYAPTAEETAYCLQALVMWRRAGGQVPLEVLHRGAAWLAENAEPPYPALWIGKCLYCPELVIRSAVLSALTLVAQE
jgi:halimadienyl-diphosphate synthase